MVSDIGHGRVITAFSSQGQCWLIWHWLLSIYCKDRTCWFATILHGFDYISTRLGDPIDSTIGSHCSTHWSTTLSNYKGNTWVIAAAVSHLGRAYRTTARCLILVNCGLGRSGVGFYRYDVTQGLPATRILYLYIIVLDTICIGWRCIGWATTF